MSYELAVKLNGVIQLDWTPIYNMNINTYGGMFVNDDMFYRAVINFHLNDRWLSWMNLYCANGPRYDFHIRNINANINIFVEKPVIQSCEILFSDYNQRQISEAEINIIFRRHTEIHSPKKFKSIEKICWKKYGF